MAQRDTLDPRVDRINGLLRKVFGRRTQGNLMDYDRLPLPEQNKLGFIATGWKFPPFYRIIGKFTNEDGSEISVLPRYAADAERYTNLYEKCFGQEATVTLDPHATNTFGVPVL